MKTLCGKFLNLAHYFLYDVKLPLLAHSRSFLANQKARNAIVGAENLLNVINPSNKQVHSKRDIQVIGNFRIDRLDKLSFTNIIIIYKQII